MSGSRLKILLKFMKAHFKSTLYQIIYKKNFYIT